MRICCVRIGLSRLLDQASQADALEVTDHDSDLGSLGCLSDKREIFEKGVR